MNESFTLTDDTFWAGAVMTMAAAQFGIFGTRRQVKPSHASSWLSAMRRNGLARRRCRTRPCSEGLRSSSSAPKRASTGCARFRTFVRGTEKYRQRADRDRRAHTRVSHLKRSSRTCVALCST